MSELVPPIRRELEAHLIGRALRDEAFRRELTTDPRAALESELARLHLEIRLPETLQVRVLEERPDVLYLVLPPDLAPQEPPSDQELLEALRGLSLDGG